MESELPGPRRWVPGPERADGPIEPARETAGPDEAGSAPARTPAAPVPAARSPGVWALAGSCLVHLGLGAVAALLVWRASEPPGGGLGPEVSLALDETAAVPRAPESHPAEEHDARAAEAPPAPRPTAPPTPGSTPELAGGPALAPGIGPPPLQGAGTPAAPTQRVSGSGAGTAVKFAGLHGGTVRSVVYVVDASGPMVTSLPLVLAEVGRSIAQLSPRQRFGVVVFRRGGPGVEAFSRELVRATPGAKARLGDWLARVEPEGSSAPLEGLRAALEMEPEAVFLLSRGIQRSGGGAWELGLERTMAELERLNPRDPQGRRRTVIKTVQFLHEDPTGIMQRIGTEHGGGKEGEGYTVIRSDDDLERDPGEAGSRGRD